MNLQQKQKGMDSIGGLQTEEYSPPWVFNEKHAPRNFVRFQIRDCVLVEFNSNTINLGEVLDVSLDGLGLRCVDHRQAMPEAGEIRIFVTTQGLMLSKIPFETVWSLYSVYRLPSGNISTRRCGIKFGPMTEAHQRALRCLIANHTTADPEG